MKKVGKEIKLGSIFVDDKAEILDMVFEDLNEYNSVAIVSDGDLVEYLMHEALKDDDVDPEYIDMTFESAVEEYILIIDDNGWLTAMPLDDYEYMDTVDRVYVDKDVVANDVIGYLCDSDIQVIPFTDFSDEDEDCTDEKTTYSVNGKEVPADEYKKIIKKLQDKYVENIKDMLSSYSDFMEEMQEWDKFLD